VSSTLLFDYPNLETLTKHILEDLLGHLNQSMSSVSHSVNVTSSTQITSTDIDALSEEAAEEELLKALHQIQGLKES
jgi:hypothetical protein